MDAALTEQVRQELAASEPASDIEVHASAGKVALSGEVPDAEAARRAVKTALGVEGVRGVVNDLEIADDGKALAAAAAH